MQNKDGYFIVIEGLDGAGTTTQAKKLDDYLEREGIARFQTREPTDGPVGDFIRNVLSGRLPSIDDGVPYKPGESELALLFAADRLEHSRTIAANKDAGATVVCDRYIFSSMAYQTLDPSITAEWVSQINRGCAVPDITFFLSVSVDECMLRITERNEKATIYENRDFLEAINDNYERLARYYEEHFGPLIKIDGSKSEAAVHSSILEELHNHLEL